MLTFERGHESDAAADSGAPEAWPDGTGGECPVSVTLPNGTCWVCWPTKWRNGDHIGPACLRLILGDESKWPKDGVVRLTLHHSRALRQSPADAQWAALEMPRRPFGSEAPPPAPAWVEHHVSEIVRLVHSEDEGRDRRFKVKSHARGLLAGLRTYFASLSAESVDPVEAFVLRVNARAEADMLAGNPVTGAHHRSLEAEIAAYRKDR